MENNNIIQILRQVKANKKYSSLSEQIVLDEIKQYLKKNPYAEADKKTIKEIRTNLHKTYSSFQTKKKNKREKYLEELKQNPNDSEVTNNLLSLTLSTKERLNNYKSIYKKVFEITNKPKTIVDLGAGLNLLSYPLMNIKPLIYYSYDIDEEDIKFLYNYFKIMKKQGLNGKAEILDIRNQNKITKLPQADIIFLFKVTDIIDKSSHKPSEQLIVYLIHNKAKAIVASFPTKTLTRKKMNYPSRKWFELMLSRNNLKFKTIKTDNEIFYIISK